MDTNALAQGADEQVEEFETPSDEGGEIVSEDTNQQADADAGGDDGESSGNEPASQKPNPVEDLAAQMGWSPKEQWRGPADKWKPADQFIRETHSINEHFKQQLQQQQKDFNDRVERNERMARIALQRQRQQLVEGYNHRMREAASMADTDTFDALMRQREQALHEFDKTAQDQLHVQRQPESPPEVMDFIGRNRDWYGVDDVMTGAATAIWGRYQGRYTTEDGRLTVSLADIAKWVEDDMRREFPNKFGGGQQRPAVNRPTAPSVEGGLKPIAGAKKKGWDSLPAEAKRAFEGFVNDGVYENDAKAKAAYAEQYWSL